MRFHVTYISCFDPNGSILFAGTVKNKREAGFRTTRFCKCPAIQLYSSGFFPRLPNRLIFSWFFCNHLNSVSASQPNAPILRPERSRFKEHRAVSEFNLQPANHPPFVLDCECDRRFFKVPILASNCIFIPSICFSSSFILRIYFVISHKSSSSATFVINEDISVKSVKK